MALIAFPEAKDPLAFAGMGIKIDVEHQRRTWNALFLKVQLVLRFCNLNHVEAEKRVRKLLVVGSGRLVDEIGAQLADDIDYLEAIVATMKAASLRLEVSEDRVLSRAARTNRATRMTTKPKTRKAPAAGPGINPKLIALAAKLVSKYARVREMHAADDGSHDADRIS